VGTVAAGVTKAYADLITISGYDGGTGSSPVLSPPSSLQAHAVAQIVAAQASWLARQSSSHGVPAYLMDDSGLAPVPPSYPEMVIQVGVRLGHSGGDRPHPRFATSFTDTSAWGLTCFRSKISCARSSIE